MDAGSLLLKRKSTTRELRQLMEGAQLNSVTALPAVDEVDSGIVNIACMAYNLEQYIGIGVMLLRQHIFTEPDFNKKEGLFP